MAMLRRHEPRGIIQFPSTYRHGSSEMGNPEVHRRSPEVQTQAAGSGAAHDGPSVDVEVRRARASDILAVPRFPSRYELNFPNTPQTELQPMRAVLRGVLPFTRDEHPVFVASKADDHRLLGVAQFRAVGPDQRWMASCVGTNPGVFEDEPIVVGLMHHAIRDAGLNGVRRLYARTSLDSPIREPLHVVGFSPYMNETILAAPGVPVLPIGSSVRTLDQTDVWAVHQLYIQSTPRDVQYAEAFTSHNWDVSTIHRDRGHTCQAWCITRNFVAAAYARAITHHDAHVIDFMVAQEWRELLPDLFAEVFRRLSTVSSRRVYISVRGYQHEFLPLLESFGFAVQAAQELSVRYTTASVRASVISVEQYARDAADPEAKRVPSFFYSHPRASTSPGELWRPSTSRACRLVDQD